LIKQKINADPAAVVFDAIGAARAGRANVIIIDTAGRLHTKVNLMEELKKIKRNLNLTISLIVACISPLGIFVTIAG
jgi:fused signal recognition particle receptor